MPLLSVIKFTMKSDILMDELDEVVFGLLERLEEEVSSQKMYEYMMIRREYEQFKNKAAVFVRDLTFLSCPEDEEAVLELTSDLIEKALSDGECPPIKQSCYVPALKLVNVYRWWRNTIHKNMTLETQIRELRFIEEQIDEEISELEKTLQDSLTSEDKTNALKQEKWFIRMMGDLYWVIDELNRTSGAITKS